MIRATRVHPHLHQDPADRVVLDHEDRRRRRMALKGERGLDVLLDLPEPTVIPDGGALILEDGREVEVVAADEPVARITAKDGPSLMRIAWHLGNRHLPTELLATELRIRQDHVIEDMVRGLGGTVAHANIPFEPESGAYAGHAHTHAPGASHQHHHHHHGHEHQAHDHGHKQDACRHGHDHHHRHGHGHEH